MFSKNLVNILETIVENSRMEFLKRKDQQEEIDQEKMLNTYDQIRSAISDDIPVFEPKKMKLTSSMQRSQERRKESLIKNNNQTGPVDPSNNERTSPKNYHDQISIKVYPTSSKKMHMRHSSINSYLSNSPQSYQKSSVKKPQRYKDSSSKIRPNTSREFHTRKKSKNKVK
mmetsp:Transcript_31268/g.27638  ORF Transcript_31268/g.27638 Transcript_31268/m.27638 type:complete len:171 (+) Transcript_31268:96-608(+)